MKKISFYLVVIVIAGLGLASFWVYQNYFKKEPSQPLLFRVERGNLQELVKVRGEAVVQKEFELEFPFAGVVDKIFVKEGGKIKKGEPLMRLEKTELELKKNELAALLNQSRSNLEKLIQGPTAEQISVSQAKVASAQKALDDSQTNLANVIQKAETDLDNVYGEIKNVLYDAQTKAEDAVNKQTDEMFTEDYSDNPQLTFTTLPQPELDAERQRVISGRLLATLKSEISGLSSQQDSLDSALDNAQNYLVVFRDFLLTLTQAVNSAAGLSSTLAATYKTNLGTGMANINTALSSITSQKQSIASQKITNQNNISSAQTEVNEAQSALKLAEAELYLLKAPARTEDIEIAEAKIQEIENQIGVINEKLAKSTLFSPTSGEVKKIYFEEREVFQPGRPAIALAASGYKIQADVSELDVGKIKETDGNEVLLRFDAYPGKELKGKVVFIEPKEIVKEEDKFYRVNVEISEGGGLEIRSGMSADLTIITASKENVLKIPALAIYKRDSKIFVQILDNGQKKETEIETGISDGEFVEIVSGLAEGQTVAVSTD